VNNTTLSGTDVEKIFEKALEKISTERGFRWIRESALTERAYLIGLLVALDEVVEEGATKAASISVFMRTMHPRRADDSFCTTETAEALSKLEIKTQGNEDDKPSRLRAILAMRKHIDMLNNEWSYIVEYARRRLDEAESLESNAPAEPTQSSNKEEIRNFYRYQDLRNTGYGLKDAARKMALLETNHEIYKRFTIE